MGFLRRWGRPSQVQSLIIQLNRAHSQRARSGRITYTIACGVNDGSESWRDEANRKGSWTTAACLTAN